MNCAASATAGSARRWSSGPRWAGSSSSSAAAATPSDDGPRSRWLAVHDIAEEGGEAGRLLLVCEACADLGGQIRKAAFPLLNLEPGAQLPGDCLGIRDRTSVV